jgi:hypothetical protein
MTLAKAIAFSIGNKAITFNGQGGSIVVQERYSSISERWLHVWIIRESGVQETDIPLPRVMVLFDAYDVDPDADYWIVV